MLQVRLAKSASFTRWDARPLTPEQLRYAREDVEHLPALADTLQARLRERGRLDWAREECRAIADATDERDPEEMWRRLPRIAGLDARERAVARELAAWRERTAAAEDRPVGAVVRDPTVVELAKRQPRSTKELGAIRGAGPDVLRRRARDIIAAIERGRAAEPVRLEEGERLGTEPVDGPAIALAEALVRARAPGGRPGLRADRRARRPRADRRRRPARPPGAGDAHARRLAARAGGRGAARAARRPALPGRRGRRADRRPLSRGSREPRAIGVGFRR